MKQVDVEAVDPNLVTDPRFDELGGVLTGVQPNGHSFWFTTVDRVDRSSVVVISVFGEQSNVRTPHGNLVHRAYVSPRSGILAGPYNRLHVSVRCHRVPGWHRFEMTSDPVTCPACRQRGGR